MSTKTTTSTSKHPTPPLTVLLSLRNGNSQTILDGVLHHLSPSIRDSPVMLPMLNDRQPKISAPSLLHSLPPIAAISNESLTNTTDIASTPSSVSEPLHEYQIIKKLGVGHFSVVSLGIHQRIGEKVC